MKRGRIRSILFRALLFVCSMFAAFSLGLLESVLVDSLHSLFRLRFVPDVRFAARVDAVGRIFLPTEWSALWSKQFNHIV